MFFFNLFFLIVLELHPYETTVGQSTKCLGKNTFLLEEIDLSNDLEKTQSDMSNKESQVT